MGDDMSEDFIQVASTMRLPKNEGVQRDAHRSPVLAALPIQLIEEFDGRTGEGLSLYIETEVDPVVDIELIRQAEQAAMPDAYRKWLVIGTTPIDKVLHAGLCHEIGSVHSPGSGRREPAKQIPPRQTFMSCDAIGNDRAFFVFREIPEIVRIVDAVAQDFP